MDKEGPSPMKKLEHWFGTFELLLVRLALLALLLIELLRLVTTRWHGVGE